MLLATPRPAPSVRVHELDLIELAANVALVYHAAWYRYFASGPACRSQVGGLRAIVRALHEAHVHGLQQGEPKQTERQHDDGDEHFHHAEAALAPGKGRETVHWQAALVDVIWPAALTVSVRRSASLPQLLGCSTISWVAAGAAASVVERNHAVGGAVTLIASEEMVTKRNTASPSASRRRRWHRTRRASPMSRHCRSWSQ